MSVATFDYYRHDRDFQLPLSGSPARPYCTWRARGLLPFNSLSRDHMIVERRVACVDIIEIFQLPLSGSHGMHEACSGVAYFKSFQLPLSGSLDQQLVVTELLTVHESFNSLSRDHRGSGSDSRADGRDRSSFQLPLSGSLGITAL